ncbi:MAG: hypothetical protein R3D02_15030 [Hyphomicrobiales bacterium]
MPTPELFRAAAAEGIISAEQADRLAAFARDFVPGGAAGAPPLVEDSEAPRFVRGFHDILMTIGVVLGLGGFAAVVDGLTGGSFLVAVASAVAAWALSEVLVGRLRLALPAIALSIAFTISAGLTVAPLVAVPMADAWKEGWVGVGTFISAAIAAGVFFWRFRVPLSLALMVGAAAAAFLAAYQVTRDGAGFGVFGDGLVLVLALAVFALALRFDLSDPERLTRRADYAFWLHLMAAPALLGSVMNILVGFRSVFELQGVLRSGDAVIVFVVMLAMSLLAVLIDRRAFLVAGLGYLGAALFSVADLVTGGEGLTGAVAVTALGVVVLLLALGWQRVRAALLAILPDELRRRLPPVRGLAATATAAAYNA